MAAFLSTGLLAEFLGVNRKTVAGWIDSRRLRGHRLPGDRDRRVAVQDALTFARANNFHSDALQRYAARQGLLPINPHILLVSPDAHLVMPLACARVEVTIAPDVLQCGMSLANTVFDAVIFDAALGMPHVREATTWLSERTPQTVVGLLANEDDHGKPPAGVTLTWQKPTDMRRVARQVITTLKGKKST